MRRSRILIALLSVAVIFVWSLWEFESARGARPGNERGTNTSPSNEAEPKLQAPPKPTWYAKVREARHVAGGDWIVIIDADEEQRLAVGNRWRIERHGAFVGEATTTRILKTACVAEIEKHPPGEAGPPRAGDRAHVIDRSFWSRTSGPPTVESVWDTGRRKLVSIVFQPQHSLASGDEVAIYRGTDLVGYVDIENVSRTTAVGQVNLDSLAAPGLPRKGDRVVLP